MTAPPQAGASSSAYTRSRPSRKTQNKASLEEPDDEDMDAEGEDEYDGEEGEDEYDGEEGEEDPTPYCFCQRRSFGVVSRSPALPFLKSSYQAVA